MLSLLFAVVALVAVVTVAVMAVISVEAWSVRVAWRTRLACELEQQRQAAALEEVSRHRARLARELDALDQDLAAKVAGAGALDLPGSRDRGAAA